MYIVEILSKVDYWLTYMSIKEDRKMIDSIPFPKAFPERKEGEKERRTRVEEWADWVEE